MRPVETLLCLLLAAATAQAQLTTSRVNVLVTGTCPAKLFLVINGEDLDKRWVELAKTTGCNWTVDLLDGSISTSTARISLRSDSARSDCRQIGANEDDRSANLEFACCAEGTFPNVSVKIEPQMPASYVRDVLPYGESLSPGVRCLERATFTEGHGEIGRTKLTREDVYLHLGPAPVKRKPATLGLLLDDVVVDDGVRVLTRDGVVYRMIVQRAKGKSRSAPTLSSNAISVDIKKLGELKFERAEIEVNK